MNNHKPLVVALGIVLGCLGLMSASPGLAVSESSIPDKQITDPDERQQAAFAVLEKHCNSCHQTEFPRRVFTEENMERMARKIYRQVFVSERMPKGEGKRAQMTAEELATLREWAEAIRTN